MLANLDCAQGQFREPHLDLNVAFGPLVVVHSVIAERLDMVESRRLFELTRNGGYLKPITGNQPFADRPSYCPSQKQKFLLYFTTLFELPPPPFPANVAGGASLKVAVLRSLAGFYVTLSALWAYPRAFAPSFARAR